MDWTTILISLFGSSGLAWVIARLCIKSVAEDVVDENNELLNEKFATKEQMQLERKDLLKEVEDKFLTLYAFREFERRIEEHFETTDRRFADSSKRFDKIDGSLEHITDLLIKERR